MAEIQLHAPMAGSQLSSSMVQPQNPNWLVGPQLLNIMVLTQLLNIMVRPHLLNTMVGTQLQLSAYMAQSKLSTWLFFKIFKFSGPSLPGMTSFTLQPISYLGFIMTFVIVISFVRERKTVPNDCAPELRAK